MSQTDSMRDFLAENPRMMGVLFTVTLLLMQATNTVVASNSGNVGP